MAFNRYSDPLSALTKSFRVGRPFGIEVRIYVTAIFVVLISAKEAAEWPGVNAGLGLLIGALSSVVLYLIVFTHELGHAFAARRFGVETHTITLSAFGGLAHLGAPSPSPRADLRIALAGPATHLVWLAVVWPLSMVVAPLRVGYVAIDVFYWLTWTNVALVLFNLLPAFPMDGGRALRALLAHRMHPNRATLIACRIGIFVAIGIGAWGLRTGGMYGTILILIAITNVLACLREMVAARHTEGPYVPVDPWEAEADAWKRGQPEPDAAYRHAEIAAEVLRAPPPPARVRRTPDFRTPEDDAELDRLLDRVSAVGIAGLSPDERERLRSLSVAHRARS